MHITGVQLTNWLRYTGEHEIDLDPTVYGIVARYTTDARRSNWAGKTAFIEAIRFALYGVHRFAKEDDWITRGIAFGQVKLTLNDGTTITRGRRRGASTRLEVVGPDGGIATQDAAQKVIDTATGLTAEDFGTSCWIGQKQLARLILARSAERFELVSAWLGLEKLQKAEEAAKARYATARDEATTVATRQKILTDRWMSLLTRAHGETPGIEHSTASFLEDCRSKIHDAYREEGELEASAERLTGELADVAERQKAASVVEKFRDIVNRGKLLSGELKTITDPVDEYAADAEARHKAIDKQLNVIGSDLRTKKQLVRGEFDGACPVAGIACPAKQSINSARAHNAQLLAGVQASYDSTCRQESLARNEYQTAKRTADDVARKRAQLDDLRAEAKLLKPKADAATELTQGDAIDAASAARTLSDLKARVGALRAQRAAYKQSMLEAETIDRELDAAKTLASDADGELAAAQTAVRIFGRQGAQRVVAESALIEIEGGANDMLRAAAIDLSIKLSWAREGSGLTPHCLECGKAFPASAKIKSCATCGAERGQKVIERLDVELSDRSGAAEDLAGAALQLAATAWLRRERDVAWSVALIDEPFGALDEANRKAFAAHLTAMLRGAYGFEQAFIVAHHPDVLDALPGRIMVSAGDNGSTLEVEA